MPVAEPEASELSISTSANLHIVNDATSLLCDNVAISFELFVRLFPATQKDTAVDTAKDHFVLVKFIGVPDFFPRFNIYKVSSIDDSGRLQNSVTFTNHSNLIEFGANFTSRGCVVQSIASDSIPVLEKVFIRVPRGIYDILDSTPSDLVKERFLYSYLSSSGSVLAQNDHIRSINGTVDLCEPFFQGKVSSATSLILIRDESEPKRDPVDLSELDESTPDLDLSLYLSRLLLFDENVGHEETLHRLQMRPLPHRISIPQVPFEGEDPELYVFVTNDVLPKLGFPVFNGDIVKLRTDDEAIHVKLFTVLEPNDSFCSDSIYISPLLFINIKSKEQGFAVIEQSNAESRSLSTCIPIAKSATIARVASPITMDKTYQKSFFAELKASFHHNMKCFKKGDLHPVCIDSVLSQALFDISSKGQNDEEENAEQLIIPTGHPDSVAWFKVVDIEGDENASDLIQFRIDPAKTAVTSSGLEFTRHPPNEKMKWHQYLQLPPIFDYSAAFGLSTREFVYAKEFHQVVQMGMRLHNQIPAKTTVLLHSMARGLGKTTLVRSTALALGANLIELDAFEVLKPGAELKTIGSLSGKIEKQLNGQIDQPNGSSYHLVYIKHVENLCVQSDPNEQGASQSLSLSLKVVQMLKDLMDRYRNLAIVASSNDIDKVSDSFRQMITYEIKVGVPSEKERKQILEYVFDSHTRATNDHKIPEAYTDHVEFKKRVNFSDFRAVRRSDVSSEALALQSAGLSPRDLVSIYKKTRQLACKRLLESSEEVGIPVEQLVKIGNGGEILLIPLDFEKAINEARNQFSDSIGAPKIPDVKWEDIGGLDLVKDEILDTIDMPLKHPELFSNGVKKRSGILFYGPPGTGKTLLAKAIATNFSLNFFSVKGPELLNMYIGESEANVRRVFQKARDAKPCVIFFDELDSVAPKRGNQGDSGGVMDRIVSQLLAELDGMSGGENSGDGVFVVGATNRPDLLDEALLRPGRFDKMLYLGISDTDEKQRKILEALTRKFKLSDDVDLHQVAEKCSFTFTGADFYALCSDSMLNAMTRTADAVDAKLKALNAKRRANGQEEVSSRWWFDNEATPEDIAVSVTMADFIKAQSELSPSVSADELAHYLRVKQNFEGGKEKAKPEMNGNGNGHLNGFHVNMNDE